MLCECLHSYTELDPVLEEERRDSLLTTSLFVPQTGTSIWEEENLVEVRVDQVDQVDQGDQVDQEDQVDEVDQVDQVDQADQEDQVDQEDQEEEDREDSEEEVKTN